MSRNAAPFMKTWVLDEIADTAGMTQAQVGAYWLLKMAMWRGGGKLPATDGALAVIARCDMSEWMAMKDRILPLFQRRGGVIRQERLTRAISDYENSFCSHSARGKKGAAEKAKKNNENTRNSAEAQPKLSGHNKIQNKKEERASKKALSSEALARPENYFEIRKAVVDERGEIFAARALDPAAWRNGSILPHSGWATMQLTDVKCLAQLGVGIVLKDQGRAA